MLQYVIYLRKSRTDADAEARGEGETLVRHEKTLTELARNLQLNVTEIYREIVSGETIAARPMMQKLLSEVEKGIWDGVLVMEIERLARGDTIDQGIVAQTFKYSDTQIITPTKTYHPNNEFDEEYFEFGLFMSRREYKTINRRLQSGRLASVREGKYVANQPPYGYIRKKLEKDKGYTLEIHPEQADVIRMIFDWYTHGERISNGSYRKLGVSLIAQKLNRLKIKPQKADSWVTASIRDILINPVYIGKIRWNWRPASKKMVDGRIKKERPRSSSYILVDGLHESLISEDTFYLAQRLINNNKQRPLGVKNAIQNPLSGIVVCGKCGRRMVRRPYSAKTKYDTLMCPTANCPNISTRLSSIEDAILHALELWLSKYQLQIGEDTSLQNNIIINLLENKLEQYDSVALDLQMQMDTIYELLEKGIYTTDQFLERSKHIASRIEENKKEKETLVKEYELESNVIFSRANISSRTEYLLNTYRMLPSAQAKNDLLKEVLEKVEYVKDHSARYKGVDPNDFTIKLYPILPYK
ncbi:MAG: Recombinase [Herbinix sp.]|nr:Recombinase [Herbinix sp.]